jgi:membrane protease YdiL (CAAX protease family)
VLFTACHFQYGWVGLLMVFILGASLAFLRWKSGSVYPCIAVHGVYNLAFAIGCFFTAH